MRPYVLLICGLLLTGVVVAAAQEGELSVGTPELVSEIDVFGLPVLTAEGTVLNESSVGYANISLTATAYDASGSVVGEGFGYVVNACGAALLPDFVLQPGDVEHYAIPLELYSDEAEVDRVDIVTEQEAVEAEAPAPPALLPGITQVSEREVVKLEWIDEDNLRFAEGCYRDLFIDQEWREYNLRTGLQEPIEHPKVELVRDALRVQLGLVDPLYFQQSMLSYAPNARRMVYQTELHTIITAEPDGSFKRVLFEALADRTLQGISWLDDGRFLAYYYGAVADPVTYFTASVDGQVLSESPKDVLPSLITPGASPDGQNVVIAAEIDGRKGYYLKRAAYPTYTFLFDAPIPDNNWPAPLYELDSDGRAYVLVAVSSEDGAKLVCFNRGTQTLHELSPLPIQPGSDDRAWWWLSPESNTIALAANGLNSGLWTIELGALKACE